MADLYLIEGTSDKYLIEGTSDRYVVEQSLIPELLWRVDDYRTATNTISTITCNKPPNVAVGDLLLALVSFQTTLAAGNTITEGTSTWQIFGPDYITDGTRRGATTWALEVRAGSGSGTGWVGIDSIPSSWTWTNSAGSARSTITVVRCVRADLSNGLTSAAGGESAISTQAAGNSGNAIPSFTVTNPERCLVVACAIAQNTTSQSPPNYWTVPGYTDVGAPGAVVNTTTGGVSWSSHYMATKTADPDGTEDSAQQVITPTPANAQSWAIAIRGASGAIDLAVADAAQAQATDAIALTQAHSLSVPDGTHAHAADAVVLTQVHNLVIADAQQAQAADEVAITVVANLVVQDATHGHTADTLALTQVHNLTVQDAAQAQATDPVTLTQAHQLAVHEAAQAQSADNVGLTQVHQLVVQDAAHGQAADSVVIVVGGITLTVADASHAQSTDAVALTQVHTLAVGDAVQGQAADSPALTQVHTLVVQNAHHAQSVDHLVLSQAHQLVVDEILQAQTADSLTLAVFIGRDITITPGPFPAKRWTSRDGSGRWTTAPTGRRWTSS